MHVIPAPSYSLGRAAWAAQVVPAPASLALLCIGLTGPRALRAMTALLASHRRRLRAANNGGGEATALHLLDFRTRQAGESHILQHHVGIGAVGDNPHAAPTPFDLCSVDQEGTVEKAQPKEVIVHHP